MNKTVNQPSLLSVVIPVYNSEESLPNLCNRLVRVFEDMGMDFEIILVNDCSTDRSWIKLEKLANNDSRVKPILLRKNVGYDSAVMAGLNYVNGQSVVIIDDDLQHAPEDIPKLLSTLTNGYDVVYANFLKKEQSKFKNFGSWFNGKVAEFMIQKPKDLYLSPFKIVRKTIVDEIIKYQGPYPYVDGLIFQTTSAITQIPIKHHKRVFGKGNYNFIRSLKIWINLTTGFSIVPLRIVSYLGLIIAIFSLIFGGYLIFWKLFSGIAPEGWTSIVFVVLFIGGIQLLALGLIGEYLGRAYLNINNQPQFVIKDKINLK